MNFIIVNYLIVIHHCFYFDAAKLRQKFVQYKRTTLNSGREIHKEGRENRITVSLLRA